MVDFLKKKIKDKNSLLECFQTWYEDSILELSESLKLNIDKDKSFIDKELSDYIKDLDTDDFDLIWTLLELKFIKIGLMNYSTNLANDVVDSLLNNYLDFDRDLLNSHKETLLQLLDNQKMFYLYIKPIFLGKADIIDGTSNELTFVYKNFTENITAELVEFDNNISIKAIEELTTYPIETVIKYIDKRDLLINQMLIDAPAFFEEVYSLALGDSLSLDEFDGEVDELETAKDEIVEFYAISFVKNFYKKLDKNSKKKLTEIIKNHFMYLMDSMTEYID